ncbi:peptidoglycan DD-metalloendopeptidase family protein [Paenibacillus protaetiae]|uniref:M23 family peptidase n=1 Tax=Paenibacillus protaetiae TaxID=2509456 RepID=A0A4P6ERK9_9BACL|nr:M23 family metallopeptidase [Paenibacillus protaetiae]QAY65166.1 M23 family peptidase [Paenibacillus protaetiae]
MNAKQKDKRPDKTSRQIQQEQWYKRYEDDNQPPDAPYPEFLFPYEQQEPLNNKRGPYTHYNGYSGPYPPSPSGRLPEQEEPDPERLWKANPNPWLGTWGQGSDPGRSPFDPTGPQDPGRMNAFWRGFRWKLAVSVIAFGAVWGMFRYGPPSMEEGRQFVTEALTKPMDFSPAAAWYKQTFAGAPSFIPIFEHKEEPAQLVDGSVKLPVVSPLPGGVLVKTFAEQLNGIELAGTSGQTVGAAQTGRVMQVTGSPGSMTVVIQNASGRTTIYGELGKAGVKKDDWVESGDPIGVLPAASGDQPSVLYFAVKENDRYIDPAGVIPLD